MAIPAPALPMLRRLAEEGARRQEEIIAWFSGEVTEAARAFALAIEQGAIRRVSGQDDADMSARWAVSSEVA
jgi:hypothetical protein